MKKLIILTLCSAVLMLSCKKGDQGEVGPQGLTGPQGPIDPKVGILADGGTIKGTLYTRTSADATVTMKIDSKYTDAVHLYNGNDGVFSYFPDFSGYNSGTDLFEVSFTSTDLSVEPIFDILIKSRTALNSTDVFLFNNSSLTFSNGSQINNYSYNATNGTMSFDISIPNLATGTGNNGKDYYGDLQIRNVPIKKSVFRIAQ